MHKLQGFALALSCFMPIFVILGMKNGLNLYELQSDIHFDQAEWDFNLWVLGLWGGLFLCGCIGFCRFRCIFLKNTKRSHDTVIIKQAENLTTAYYFTYFGFFVISFFSVDPTKVSDVISFCVILTLVVIVYVTNKMYFINPMVTLLGYKSFKIVYSKPLFDSEGEAFECNVYSKEDLTLNIGKQFFLTFSPLDFSICFPKVPKTTAR